MRFVADEDLGDMPNVIVDGAAAESTVLVLSHWPHSPTPAALRADLSAQIAFNYVRRPDLQVAADAASNNHFDQDGLVGLYAVLQPAAASAHEALLVDVAAAGDFATYRDRRAARAAMAIAAWADPERSPLQADVLAGPYPALAAACYQDCLPRIIELATQPEHYRSLWEEEDAFLAASEAALAEGRVVIDERPDVDLAVVRLPDGLAGQAHRFASVAAPRMIHPMAVANATRSLSVLLAQGRRFELEQRYESWVRLASHRPRPRVDLQPLAQELDALEGDHRWHADPPSALTPTLALAKGLESDLDAQVVTATITRHLATAPPAWDPT